MAKTLGHERVGGAVRSSSSIGPQKCKAPICDQSVSGIPNGFGTSPIKLNAKGSCAVTVNFPRTYYHVPFSSCHPE